GNESACQNRQDVVGAVADQDLIRRNPQDWSGGVAKRVAERLGVLSESIARQRFADGIEDSWRRRVGILVGVELDVLAVARLLARNVAGHLQDIRANAGHKSLSFKFQVSSR